METHSVAMEAYSGAMKVHSAVLEGPVVADNQHFDEDPDPDPHQNERPDPEPHQRVKSDPDLHRMKSLIQILINVRRFQNT